MIPLDLMREDPRVTDRDPEELAYRVIAEPGRLTVEEISEMDPFPFPLPRQKGSLRPRPRGRAGVR